jgi:O-antigen/teichoic acid export membrane protein
MIERQHARHLVGYAISRFVPALVGFLAIPIYTSLLTPAEFGRYNLVVAAVAIADALCFQWLVVSIVRFLPTFGNDRPVFVSMAGRYYVLIVSAVAAVCLVVSSFLDHDSRLIFLTGLALLAATAWNEVNLELARSAFRVREFAAAAAASAVLALVFGVSLAYRGFGAGAPLLGSFAALTLTGGVFLFRSRRAYFAALSLRDDLTRVRPIVSYGGPMALALLISSLLNTSDRFLINHLIGPAGVGVYSAAWGLMFPTVTLLGSTINLAGYPQIVYGFERNDGSVDLRIREQLTLLLKILVPAVIGAAVLSQELGRAFLGSQFASAAATLIPGLALAAALSAIRSLYTDLAFHLSKRTAVLSGVMLIALVTNWVANIILLPSLGVRGAVLAAVVAYAVALILSISLGRRLFALPRPRLFEVVAPLLSSAAMTALLFLLPAAQTRAGVISKIVGGSSVYFLVDWIVSRSVSASHPSDPKL